MGVLAARDLRVDIGKIVAPIARGEHTHVQNLKTKRW